MLDSLADQPAYVIAALGRAGLEPGRGGGFGDYGAPPAMRATP